jgi:transcriptional regulator with XRE-family HTH domain
MIDDDAVNAEVGALIRARRQKRKLTLEQLAELSGGDFVYTGIAMYERGQRAVTPARLVRLAELLGCAPASLLPKAKT